MALAEQRCALCQGGRLHAFIDEPKGSVSVELVLEPNSCDPVPPGAPEKRKECLPHPLGQFEIDSIELACLGGKKDIERAPPALVRLKECYVAEHICGLTTFRQSYRPFDPHPELLGGPHKVRLISNGDRRAQNASHGSADRMIQRQRFFASHRFVLRRVSAFAVWAFGFRPLDSLI
jgi:hypothetical protein